MMKNEKRSDKMSGENEKKESPEHILEGKPTSDYYPKYSCPVCDDRWRDDNNTISVFKPEEAETYSGIAPKDFIIEVHCNCGWHYWVHHDWDKVRERNHRIACCDNCKLFDGEHSCEAEANKYVYIENPEERVHCNLARYYVLDGVGD